MSELGIVALALAISFPLCLAVLGFFCMKATDKALKHLEETQMIGGTPRKLQEEQMRRQQILAEKRKPTIAKVMS